MQRRARESYEAIQAVAQAAGCWVRHVGQNKHIKLEIVHGRRVIGRMAISTTTSDIHCAAQNRRVAQRIIKEAGLCGA